MCKITRTTPTQALAHDHNINGGTWGVDLMPMCLGTSPHITSNKHMIMKTSTHDIEDTHTIYTHISTTRGHHLSAMTPTRCIPTHESTQACIQHHLHMLNMACTTSATHTHQNMWWGGNHPHTYTHSTILASTWIYKHMHLHMEFYQVHLHTHRNTTTWVHS